MENATRIAALSLVCFSALAFSQQQPSPGDAIKARQGLMQLQKFSLGAVNNAVKDGGNLTEAAIQAAQNLNDTSDLVATAFDLVKDSGVDKQKGQTRSKPEIWTNSAEFREMAMAFKRDTEKLAAAAKSKDASAVRDQVKAVGGGCNGCHKKFRAEQ
jgi:cytochrome c556